MPEGAGCVKGGRGLLLRLVLIGLRASQLPVLALERVFCRKTAKGMIVPERFYFLLGSGEEDPLGYSAVEAIEGGGSF
jgi:hypothetical protein